MDLLCTHINRGDFDSLFHQCPYTIESNLLFLWFFISPAWWWIVSILCVIGKDSRSHYLQTTPFCFHFCSGDPCFLSLFFTFLIICWCNGSIFNKRLLECADALSHRKRTWLRTFWRLTLAPLLCSSVSLMKWESRMRIAWCRDCSTGELWEIDSQTVRDWIRLLRNSWRSHLHYETALVNNHKVIRRRIWTLLT